MLNIPENKTFILHHGIYSDLKKLNNKKREIDFNYILGLSVVAPHKNFETLIKAFSIIKIKYNYSGKLLIVGDTCYEDYYIKLQNLIKDLNLKNDVILTGKIPNDEVFNYYVHCDLFVFPSLEETFGIPLIEALSLGVPTIASDGKKYNNLFIPFNELAGEYAIYFDPYSEEDLAEKINMVLSNKELKNKFSENAKIFRTKYDISIVASELIKEFNSLGGK
jgi:glycosyltransferase involved in cell wall biosynthesis